MKVIDYESRALKCPYCGALIQYKPEELIQYWHEYEDKSFLYEGILCPHCANFISEPIHRYAMSVTTLTPEIYLKAVRDGACIAYEC